MGPSVLPDKYRNAIPFSVGAGAGTKNVVSSDCDGQVGGMTLNQTQDDQLLGFVLGSSWPIQRYTRASLAQGYSDFKIDDGYLSDAVEIVAQNSTGSLLFKFNHTIAYSSRVLLSIFWNSSSFQTAPHSFPGGIRCDYLVWALPSYQNSFGTGGIMYFVASAFGLLSAFYAEEMVRIREVGATCSVSAEW